MSILIIQNPADPTEEANSVIDLVDARELAVSLGVTLPEDDTAAESALLTANDYVNALSLIGYPVNPFQGTAFPRIMNINGEDYPQDKIPDDVKRAIVVIASYAEGDLYGTTDGRELASKDTAGVISKSWFQSGKKDNSIEITRAHKILAKYIVTTGFNNFGLVL